MQILGNSKCDVFKIFFVLKTDMVSDDTKDCTCINQSMGELHCILDSLHIGFSVDRYLI